MISPEQLGAIRAALKGLKCTEARDTLETFARDESGLDAYPPQLVVFPRDTAEVQEIFRICQAHLTPLVPVGARSGKSGGSLAVHGGVALSFEKMNKILAVCPEDRIAIAQPGVVLETLHQAVEAQELFYPPDPNSSNTCTLGGTVAENAAGPRALKYGTTRDYILSMEWVLPNGEVLRPGRQTSKGVAGYDLIGLLVGSEGTLGVATEMTVKLLPAPRVVMTALFSFASVLQAAHAVRKMRRSRLLPRALELLDDVAIAAIKSNSYPIAPAAQACLIVEVDGYLEAATFAELEALAAICTDEGAVDTVLARDRNQRARLWEIRHLVSSALRTMKAHKLSEDVVVPQSKIPEAIHRFKAIGASLGVTIATYGHAGDGNLHANILWDSAAQRPHALEAARQILELTVKMKGSISGEHGVGLAKRQYLALELSPLMMQFQESLKRFFDPQGLMNPGKIFDAAGDSKREALYTPSQNS